MENIKTRIAGFIKLVIYRFIPFCFLYPFFKIFGRIEIKGRENILKGGVLIASNHLSYVDPLMLATFIPKGCLFMAKHEIFSIPVLKYLIGYYAFPVNRSNPQASAIKFALEFLEKGKNVVIFPEGKRTFGVKSFAPKSGIGMLSVMSSKPVIPAFISGTEEFLPNGAIVPNPVKLKILFGKPLFLDHFGSDYDAATKTVMAEIKRLAETI